MGSEKEETKFNLKKTSKKLKKGLKYRVNASLPKTKTISYKQTLSPY